MFGFDGQLLWYRSQNFGSVQCLKKAIPALTDNSDLACLVLEGGGNITTLWENAAQRKGISCYSLHAQEWREMILHGQHWEAGLAKEQSVKWARKVIDYCGGRQQKALRHDAAESILCGFYVMIKTGIIQKPPGSLFPYIHI